MKKKNLVILLLIPFLISLLGIITINFTINTFYGDITSIVWDYEDMEAFELSDKKYKLEATPYNSSNAPLDSGNSLVWKCENVDLTIEEPIAEIEKNDDNYYLKTNRTGEVVITCSNLKGNIFRRMRAIIYQDGVVLVTPEISSSQNNIDPNVYYGEYDLKNGEKVKANFSLKIRCIPEKIAANLQLTNVSNNINVSLTTKRVEIKDAGNKDAYFTINAGSLTPTTFSFKIVENGVNVYSYEDLLNCTNKSEQGEIVVLRKSFESKEYLTNTNENNVELFGNKTGYRFKDEVFYFETTYNQSFIKGWNEFVDSNNSYSKVSNKIIAGLRVQKDFYGNGYTINMHNLTYPTGEFKQNGISIPDLKDDDLFRGPLPFYTLGNPNKTPLVSAYGQDNVGMYIDGNNITVNDVNIRNCDLRGSLSFLDTVGTVVEVRGDNNTIKNSRLLNGKNILRCFSTQNFALQNSLLSNSRNFLLEVGTNEYMNYDEISKFEFIGSDNSVYNLSIKEYFGTSEEYGDNDILAYLLGMFSDKNVMRNCLLSVQNALNDKSKVAGIYKGTVKVVDTLFYNSGIAAISMHSMFNGPFLYKPVPSMIFDKAASMIPEITNIIPYAPSYVGGMSYPVKLDLEGKTKFYDYKETGNIDITGLIKENISSIVNDNMDLEEEININIDTIFPIKPYLLSKARNNNSTFKHNEKEYINIPIAYYGGGLNLSTINIDKLDNKEIFADSFDVDFLDYYLTSSGGSIDDLLSYDNIKNMILKCVTIVTGFEPFKFVCLNSDDLYGQSPNIDTLISNAKGE